MCNHHPQKSQLPTTTELLQIVKLLNDEPIPKVLSNNKTIPRILLTAAKRGIKQDAQVSPTKPLVDSLLTLSKPAIIAKTRNRNHNIRKPSPFSKTRAAQLDKTEADTINRAATWATTLLTDCIRGTPTDLTKLSPPLASVPHHDKTAVFIAPRDTLDPVLAKRYAKHATHCLEHPFFRNNLSALLNVQTFLTSSATVSSRHINLCLPVLERALHTFRTAPCPLLPSDQSCALQRALERSSTACDPQSELFALLSSEAKATLCIQNPQYRKTLRLHIEKAFSSQNNMPYTTERATINPLARVAAIDINFHWQIMDDVRTLVSGPEAPFSLHLWSHRRLFRALFSETLRLIAGPDNHESTHANLVNRFPPFGRPVVRLLSALSGSLQSQDTRRQRMAVSMAGKLIWKMLKVEQHVVWTPNVHALMICAESLLELFCWAVTFSLNLDDVKATFPKERKHSTESDPLTCACYLSALMETSRLPGGELVETEMQVRSTVLSTRKFLLQNYRKRQLDLGAAFREKRINGLVAFGLSGILGRQDLDISVKSWERVAPADKESLVRSLEKSKLWATDGTTNSRYGRYCETLAQLN